MLCLNQMRNPSRMLTVSVADSAKLVFDLKLSDLIDSDVVHHMQLFLE